MLEGRSFVLNEDKRFSFISYENVLNYILKDSVSDPGAIEVALSCKPMYLSDYANIIGRNLLSKRVIKDYTITTYSVGKPYCSEIYNSNYDFESSFVKTIPEYLKKFEIGR